MKNLINKALIILSALGMASQADAYTYSFTNHTAKKIAVGMKYKGSHYTEFIVVKPNERQAFQPGSGEVPGVKSFIGAGKAGYLPSQWLYLVNPPFMSPKNQETVPWRAFSITWIPSDYYDIALEIAEALGDAAEKAGKAGLKAGAAYMTGGTSLAADAAQELVEKAAKKVATADAMKEVANADFNFGKLISSIGKAVGRSMAASRHIDIVEDEDGKISFLSIM